jgi:hypothetical protein
VPAYRPSFAEVKAGKTYMPNDAKSNPSANKASTAACCELLRELIVGLLTVVSEPVDV